MGKIETLHTDPVTPVEKIYNKADKTNYFVYNISSGMDNWSQRNSKYTYTNKDLKVNAFTLCNVHVMAMGLIYTGVYDRFKKEIDIRYPELIRFPDKLAKYLIEDPEMRKYFAKRFPKENVNFVNGVKDAYTPNELHNSLSYGVNKFIDAGIVTYFSTNVAWKEIMYDLIYKGCPVGISGKFSGLDHIDLVVGCAYKRLGDKTCPSDNQVPDYLIVDDPFGKTYEYNKGLSGNDVWIPFSKCIDDFKPHDNPKFKFAHRFIKPQWIGF